MDKWLKNNIILQTILQTIFKREQIIYIDINFNINILMLIKILFYYSKNFYGRIKILQVLNVFTQKFFIYIYIIFIFIFIYIIIYILLLLLYYYFLFIYI